MGSQRLGFSGSPPQLSTDESGGTLKLRPRRSGLHSRNGDFMLKINTHNDGTTIDFDLEGKLAGPWVDELARCWEPAVAGNRRARVILNAVTFIDAAGKKL